MQAKDSVLITEGGAGEMLMAREAVHVGAGGCARDRCLTVQCTYNYSER